MSALFPMETNVEMPRPSVLALSMMDSPSAPLWDMNPTRPGGGACGANVALSLTSGSVFRIPMQLGPMRRMPYSRHVCTNACCLTIPSEPTSEKPDEITTRA
jgi:hypothetical protein